MRLSRPTPVVLASLGLVLSLGLTACGGSQDKGLGLDSVSISGPVGQEPTVKWSGQLTDGSADSKVLVKGDGPAIQQGDQVIVHTWMGDGYTQKVAQDSYTQHAPQVVPVDDKLTPVYLDAIKGATVGSRVVVSESADKLFGAIGNPDLKIGNKDVVVVMFDLVGKLLDGPQGSQRKAPAWAPTIKSKKGLPARFGFHGTPAPDGKLRSAVLQQGTGATVKKGQTIFAHYLGEVYAGSKPFDQNYTGSSATQPASFRIGVGQVVKGWDKVLVGQKVGSRVLMAIPPKLGYGTKGNSQAGIKGTDTLYFVVDILGAA